MYIIKNALKCISRSKGRNILIGIIVLVIAVSACLGLSIRQAAESAKEEALGNMKITATISFDRQSMMQNMMGSFDPSEMAGGGKGFDKDQFSSLMGEAQEMSLEEYQKYAEASSVSGFYYSLTVPMNGSDDFEAVSSSSSTENTDDEEESTEGDSRDNFPGGRPGGGFGGMATMVQSDFTVIGYSSDSAMTAIIDGTMAVTDGAVFEEGTANYDCIISEELASYNSLEVGSSITLSNPNSEDETYTLNVVGIFSDSSANENSFSMMGATSQDPANKIYLSYTALASIIDESEAVATTETDEDTGIETSTKLTGTLSGTYTFDSVENYESFDAEARTLGLGDDYTISSSDVEAYESSLAPLSTLSTMAGYFLIVILLIGAIILVVLNIFNVRERKYEIGVLTAMGMKKAKVAAQFMTEIFSVTLVAVILGAVLGGIFSVPVTNALLENQIASQNEQSGEIEQGFGREPGAMGGGFGGNVGGGAQGMSQPPSGGGGMFGGDFANIFGGSPENNYVSSVTSAMNITVVLQMLGIAVLLTLVAGAVAILFVMRYEPLKILSNRD